jgi:hypothetical protein
MHELEDDLKLQNWLSVLTFDVYKYAKAGGAVVIEWTDSGLAIHLTGIAPDTPGVNSKLRLVATDAAPQEEATP